MRVVTSRSGRGSTSPKRDQPAATNDGAAVLHVRRGSAQRRRGGCRAALGAWRQPERAQPDARRVGARAGRRAQPRRLGALRGSALARSADAAHRTRSGPLAHLPSIQVQALLAGGAKTTEVDHEGWTPVTLAVANGHLEVGQGATAGLCSAQVCSRRARSRSWSCSRTGYDGAAGPRRRSVGAAGRRLHRQDAGHAGGVWRSRGSPQPRALTLQSARLTWSEPSHCRLCLWQEVARLLLARGADVNATDRFGWSALMLAAYSGHAGIVKVLLDHGASPATTSAKVPRPPPARGEGPPPDPRPHARAAARCGCGASAGRDGRVHRAGPRVRSHRRAAGGAGVGGRAADRRTGERPRCLNSVRGHVVQKLGTLLIL